MHDKIIFSKKTPFEKGWSSDKKYYAEDINGKKYLLRISSADKYEKKKTEFEMMKKAAALDIPMCSPLEFGKCAEGVYIIQSWINGEDAEQLIPQMSEAEQYSYGLDAGKILKKLHTLHAPIDYKDEWSERFTRKVNKKIEMYENCPVKFSGDACFLDYLLANRELLENRPQCFHHGDYHIGNMMLENGKLVVIDFDRSDFGDPWEEFNRIVWSAQAAPFFATGIVDGYFDKNIPEKFWRLLLYYISSNTISSVVMAIPFGKSETETMLKQTNDILFWYDNFNNIIPNWYYKNFNM